MEQQHIVEQKHMHEVVLYRKHRPQTFDDVVGQEHVVHVLRESVREGNISHAYLFHGSRGTGKTSIARILAREIGCSPEDIYEIDAASNRGIDDMRELREGVRTLPFKSPYKTYIIDEVHMLSKDAFNAFLKTLEEPPRHVVFVLATTEINKVPETIISRCQHFAFKRPSGAALRSVVLKTAKIEGYFLEHAAAELVALLGDGSFRDTLGVLQKVFHSVKGKEVSIEDVERITNAPPSLLVTSLIQAIADADLESALAAVGKAVESHIDFTLFLKLMLEKLRLIILLRYTPAIKKELEKNYSADDLAFLEELVEKKDTLNSNTLMCLLDVYTETARSCIPELPLELALIKIIKKE